MSSQAEKKSTSEVKSGPYPPYNQPPQVAYGWFCAKPPPYGPYFWPCLPPGYCLVPVQQAKAMAEANSGAQAPSMQAAAAPAAAPAVPNMATTPAVPSSTATVVAGAPAPQAMIPARVPQPGVQIAPATWAQTAATTARLYPAGMQPAVGYGAAAAPLVAAGALKRPQPPVVAPADAGRNVRRRVNPPMKQEAAPTIGMPTT